MPDTGNLRTVVLEDGTRYIPVSERLRLHQQTYPMEKITFGLERPTENLVMVECMIKDSTGRVIANGFAEEDRRDGPVNRTSAVENAQTSAIGRALFARGFGNGAPIPECVTLENGNLYEPVELRAKRFREGHAEENVVFKPTVAGSTVLFECRILGTDGEMRANAFAEEDRNVSEINRMSAVENAQTSAFGRALYVRGFGNGEICSREELRFAQLSREALEQSTTGPRTQARGNPPAENRRENFSIEAAPRPESRTAANVIPESLRGESGLNFERHGSILLVRGQNQAATASVRGLLESSGFRPNTWAKRVAAGTIGLPADLPPLRGIRYERHGNMIITIGNAYSHRTTLKDNGWELWWLKQLAEQAEAA